MLAPEILRSEEDNSINFITTTDDGGAIEARFAQRVPEIVVVYLSSASGCNLSCRMCHLTQTNQTMTAYVDVNGYLDQAETVLSTLHKEGKIGDAKYVHFNFMARGDALANPLFIEHTQAIILGLGWIAKRYGLHPKFKISTIFPKTDLFGRGASTLNSWVTNTLAIHGDVEFYYSLYTTDRTFRKRWIPKAFDIDWVGEAFCGTVHRLRLHHALIDGENTSLNDVLGISDWLVRHKIQAAVNLVEYNPFDTNSGRQPSEDTIEQYCDRLEKLPNVLNVRKVIPVARDVYASCGMFVLP